MDAAGTRFQALRCLRHLTAIRLTCAVVAVRPHGGLDGANSPKPGGLAPYKGRDFHEKFHGLAMFVAAWLSWFFLFVRGSVGTLFSDCLSSSWFFRFWVFISVDHSHLPLTIFRFWVRFPYFNGSRLVFPVLCYFVFLFVL